MNTEKLLQDALRPAQPDDGFAARVQARIAAQAAAAVGSQRGTRRRWLLPTALAATLLLAVGISQQVSQRREHQRELYAHEQLMHALAITSARLDDVHRHLERNSLE